MSVSTSVPTGHAGTAAGGGERATFADALRSEWTKFRTLRSTAYTMLTVMVIGVGLGALISHGTGRRYATMSPADQAAFDPTYNSLQACWILAQLAVGVLGVLVITSEYATGMMRTSATAVPRRTRLLAAKALVAGVAALAVGEVTGFGAFLAGQSLIARTGAPHAALGDPHVLRAVAGTGLYLAVIALYGVALGPIVRSTAGAITALVATTLIVPLLVQALPDPLNRWTGRFWPSMAGTRIMTTHHAAHVLGPWGGFALMCAAVAALLAVAFAVFRLRDV